MAISLSPSSRIIHLVKKNATEKKETDHVRGDDGGKKKNENLECCSEK